MAQSTTTVTPDGPTPPTNYPTPGYVGMRPPTTAGLAFQDDGPQGPLVTFAKVTSGKAYEGAGTETLYTAPGSRAACPTQSVSDLGNYTTHPNGTHASSLTPTPSESETKSDDKPDDNNDNGDHHERRKHQRTR